PLYNIGGYLRIDGTINPVILEKALNQVIEENDALRIILQEGENLPTQAFAQNIHIKLDFYDFSAQENAHELAFAWMKQSFGKLFQLYDNPLFQFALCKIAPDCYYLYQKYHHIIVDGWAISLLVQRVGAAYNALTSRQFGEQKHYCYQNFLQNDQAYLNSEKFAKAKRYWLNKYSEIPEPLLTRHYAAQFGDKIIPSQLSFLHLKRPFYNQLIEFAKENKASTFHLFLGILYCYFSKTTGQKDIVIGLPILNRGTAAFKQTLGLFTNIIPARFNFGQDLSFVELMQAISMELRRDYRYQKLPISEINRGLHNIKHRQLFDIMLSYAKHDFDTDFNDSPASMVGITNGFDQNALEIHIREFHHSQDVRMDFEYNLGAFQPDEIEIIKARFEFLLGEILRQPDVPIRKLRIRSEAEMSATRSNSVHPTNPFIEFPKTEQSIGQRFEQQVKLYPDKIAVKTQNYVWSYSELNNKANQVAQVLLGQSDERIALLFEHDAPMLVGIIGVLKAGKTYVPLTPDFPRSRLEYIAQDSQASVILTNNLNLNLAQTLINKSIRLINIDNLETSTNNIQLTVSPDSIAYLLYTSGSTGQPKGVIQNHRNILHFIRTYTNNLHITTNDKLTLVSFYSFDAAIIDIFSALLNGATLYPVNLKEENFVTLSAWLIEQQITIYHSTPTVYRHWLKALTAKDNFYSIRLIVLGGEPVYKTDIEEYKKHFSNTCLFVNGLGSTESTFSLQYFLDKQTQISRDEVPVGYPLKETEILLLDDTGVETDIYGEIAIKSPYLALGYWQKYELTEAVFLPDPEGGNRRIYRSGDMGRLLPDGSLKFVGRKDFQIKLRGFRIEPGEIEATLTQHENVKEAVVVLYNKEDNPRLVAYIILAIPNEEVLSVLRTWLKTRLPEYMVPASFTVLDKLPLTPNGKINRQALPAPDLAIQVVEQAARTETEHLLCNLWSQVLGISITSQLSNFFEAGGHSLLATQLVSRIRLSFEIEMPLRVIFEHPILQEQAEWLDNEQRGSQLPPIRPLTEGEPLVLSFAQQRLWFLAQLEGKSATYNMPAALHMSGQLNETALQGALTALIQRHDSLRLCFPVVDGEATVQLNDVYNPLSITDLSELSETEQQAQVTKLIANHAQAPFDLSTGPLLSLRLLKLTEQEQILLFNMHHIISDGWSRSLMIRELSKLYNAYCQNREAELPNLPIQYPDYAAWQRNWLSGQVLERQLAYWKDKLSDVPELLELPTDYPRPAVQQHQGDYIRLHVPSDLTAQLKQFSRQNNLTLFMTLLGAFYILLYRYTGQDDICIGTPVANRNHTELEGLIGLFLNTVVLRIGIHAKTSFQQFMAQIRQTTLEAFAYQDVPFELLVEQLQPQRSLSHHPLFQVMFNLINIPKTSELELMGIHTERLQTSLGLIAKFDLNLAFIENSEGLTGRFEYDTALFTEETIRFLGECYLTLLQEIVAKPDVQLSQLSLLSEAWRSRVADLQHPTPTNSFEPFDDNIQNIPECFALQVQRYPDRIAVCTEQSSMTYRELDQAARRLSAALLKRNNNQWVALLHSHDSNMIVGILGVLQAGCAYIPLNTNHPVRRLQYILEDAQTTTLVCDNQFQSLAEQLTESDQIINLDILSENPATSLPEINPDSIAYLLYTSGSTGQPKGVIQNHRNVLHFIRNYTNNLHITANDRLTVLASFNFDAAVVDIFAALLNGATLYPFNLKQDSFVTLSAWLTEQKITIYHSTPTVYRHWLKTLTGEDNFSSIRLVVLGGEPVYKTDIEGYKKHFSNRCLFVNGFGSTESTFSLQYFLDKQTQISRDEVPVGYPLKETEILLLDDTGVETDIYGEIAIKSPYLALGYWQKYELTEAVFLPDPEGGNRRIYRSGDMGRLLPDGSLKFVGRKDFQIKLRGFRIEPGEIEATLTQHENVKEAVVVLYNKEDNPRLVAYIILAIPNEEVLSVLRTWLKTRLPEYMVPASFTVLDKLPLTPNGKINRQALPAPDLAIQVVEQAARTETEHLLCNLWSQVLGISITSQLSNFFEAGGHSLLATQLVSRIRLSFEIEMPLRVIFEHPILQEQAEWLDNEQRGSQLPPIRPLTEGEPLVLSFAQQRLWFLAQLEGKSATYNMPAALHMSGQLNETALQGALTALIQRHDSLRLCFPVVDGEATVQLNDVYNPLSITDLSELSETEQQAQVTKLIANHAQAPFDLNTGPLLSLRLIKLAEQEQILLFNMHHTISDGWSMGVLIREWSQLYNAYAQNQAPQLPKLPIQYTDYAAWQRDWLKGSVLEQQLAYWTDKLAGAPELLELPTDYPRPAIMRYQGKHLQSTLEQKLTQGIKQLSQQHGVTIFMTLLAAFNVLLSRYSGQTDLVVGSPIANR
ncbi:MAG: amino acid adenylation domain-containing protein, partial [Pseudomonadota bacterium]